MGIRCTTIFTAFLVLFCRVSVAQAATNAPVYTASLQLVSGGVAGQTSYSHPHPVGLLPYKPASVLRIPQTITNPVYGEIQFGPADHPTSFAVVSSSNASGLPVTVIDDNHNGDLTDDKPVDWKPVHFKGFNGLTLTRYIGSTVLDVPYKSGSLHMPLQLILPAKDPSDPNAAAEGNTLLYVPDYIRKGSVELGGVTYTVMLYDSMARGDFRPNLSPAFGGTWLLIDVNHNGVIDQRGETYEVGKPFNIAGVTYNAVVPHANGAVLQIYKSSVSVPQILPPPNLSPGHLAPSFRATTLTGKQVAFPGDYRGKWVMLYFWGSWCPDCAQQNPYMEKAYKKYHARGLHILGISIDQADFSKQVEAYTHNNNMNWPDIYDGKMWNAAIAQLYFIRLIPTPLLIDGTTGKIVAGRDELLHGNLDTTLSRILAHHP